MLALCLVALSFAPQETYRQPSKEVVDLVDAPLPPAVRFSPDNNRMLITERDTLPPISELSRRMLRLAGMRIDPAANGPFRIGYDKSLALRRRDEAKGTPIALPPGAKLAAVSWSHDSKHFAYTLVTDRGTELFVGAVDKPAAAARMPVLLNCVLGPGFTWMPDGSTLLCTEVPADRGPEPPAPAVPLGPNVQETHGEKSPVRTYQDMLASPYDEKLFQFYATSGLALVRPADASVVRFGTPDLYDSVETSPDAKHFLVTRMRKPFSYLQPAGEFPQTIEVVDVSAKREYLVAEVPLAANIPIEGVRKGPRSVHWKAGAPATLVWCEALDDGDPKKKVPFRDHWLALAAPFSGDARELFKLENRAQGILWMENANEAIAGDYDRDRRWVRSRLFDLAAGPDAKPVVLDDRNMNDRYKDPGRPILKTDASGRAVVHQDGPWIYRAGAGASPDGERPFLAKQNLESLATERLWESEKGSYESVVELVTDGTSRTTQIITRHESPTSPPNLRLRTVGTTTFVPLTDDPDPQPKLRGITKELVKYKRADGTDLSATLYLPAGTKPGARLPLVVWAYPMEFTDAATAGQVSGSPNRFTRIGGISHLFFLTQGYAVMDNATMPIVGNPETMNDTFLDQIVSSAQAAIDFADARGVGDRNRVGVGGHSYGAFMTANLLAHCDLFRAGIARSGAYNRTLTPFGFQSERRTLWEAPKSYVTLSPFMVADKINEPILLIHGEADNNQGTFPIQSERLFQALKGNGGTARLVMLPKEAHGYAARESTLQVLAEMFDWFGKYVKDAPARDVKETAKPADAGGHAK